MRPASLLHRSATFNILVIIALSAVLAGKVGLNCVSFSQQVH